MEGIIFSKAINSQVNTWKSIPDIGRTGHRVTMFSVNFKSTELTKNSPHLEVDVWLNSAKDATIQLMFSPTLEFNNNNNKGLRYGISVDDEIPSIVEIHKDRSQK